jgi:Nuclease A inhibitor-like protein
MNKAEQITQELKNITENLVYASESEYPFTVVRWDGKDRKLSLSNESLLQVTKYSSDLPITIVNLEDFFHRAITAEEWHSEPEQANVIRFKELIAYLKANFGEVKVFKVGEFEFDAYILGIIDGDLVGLQTKVVQT